MTEETRLGLEAGTEDSAGLEGIFKGIVLTEEGRLGIMEGLSFRVLAEEGVDVLKHVNKIKLRKKNQHEEKKKMTEGTMVKIK